ncbi:hypothetical protein D9758_001322 [Tetrapyrgos nigripes]|uniref:Sodium/calcium exchanger membrane region domain-containing protein n=1 Tax=Tetrapyrgos nigripes TaxID=182062 RepID=A0A8H5LUG2_9AGAR|nr:hypothetical protein D9758_001322 [Tetrapyrgos nigripes]
MSGDYTHHKNESLVRLTGAAGYPQSLSRDQSIADAAHLEWHQRTQSQYTFVEESSEKSAPVRFADRFLRRGRKNIGVLTSLKRIALGSCMNVLLPVIPIAWVAHFLEWTHELQFILCLVAIVPLQQLFEYGGSQLAFYVGKQIGDLIIISLNNIVEGILAIVLLLKCELRLLQSTIIGVVLLHLLLVPGGSFLMGGARVAHQDLHPHITQLNHTLLMVGVLTLLLPTASFSALERGLRSTVDSSPEDIINAHTRQQMIDISRGLAVLLLILYFSARLFLINPPGEGNSALSSHPDAPLGYLDEEERLVQTEPEINQWVCLVMLLVTIGIMSGTAEWLVDSIEFVKESETLSEEWFGLVLLPVVSFSGDGVLAMLTWVRRLLRHYLGWKITPVQTLAKAQSIDTAIQYLIAWVPIFVLLGWSKEKPLLLLFDSFEVAILVASCFLINVITSDSKVNWAEGLEVSCYGDIGTYNVFNSGVALILFYAMIALTAWFYEGQKEIAALLSLGPECVAEGHSG